MIPLTTYILKLQLALTQIVLQQYMSIHIKHVQHTHGMIYIDNVTF